jgi:asparagine synthase (glutamine-hydrolysing)
VAGAVDPERLVRMRDALIHRGPDDEGVWIDASGRIGLAHRRLSIIDLSAAGQQPMSDESGSLVLTFNGEIYNFRQLRAELVEKGYRFKSQTDTEVVLYAYAEWGVGAIARLNGMFAFALYDRDKGQMIMARDRFGEKPLYYSLKGGTCRFASELKGLAVEGGLSLRVDPDLLYPYLVFGYMPYPDTAFDGARKLPPASYLALDTTSLETEVVEYWTLDREVDEERSLTVATDGLAELFTEAVGMRMVADVPVGAFLSGGVDSTLVVAAMKRFSADVKTFSIGFWDRDYDEAPFAKAIADHLGCDHYEHYVEPKEAIDVLMGLPAIYDEPYADSSAIPTFIVSRFARKEVKVVLTGDGGDELFGGYTAYPTFARLNQVQRLPVAARLLAAGLFEHLGVGKLRRHADLLRQRELWQLFLYVNERTVAKQPDAGRLLFGRGSAGLAGSEYVRLFNRDAADPLRAAMHTEARTYLVDDILTKVDRASMAVSLEARVPFLDHRIAEYAARLPTRTRLGKGGQERKRVLRELLGRSIPPHMFERRKHGFAVPLHKWFRGELRWLLDEYLAEGRIKREGIFDPKVVKGLVAEHLSGARDREAVLWALVFWEMWREQWNV